MSRVVPLPDAVGTLLLRTAWLLVWTWLSLAHVTAAVLVLVGCELRPGLLSTWLAIAEDWFAGPKAAAIGLTGLGAFGAYAWLVRKAAQAIEIRLRRYLIGVDAGRH